MARSLAEVLKRRVIPRAVVIVSQISWPARVGASARRRLGRRGCVELFFSFDDPCSAIAVIDLADRLAGRDVRLVLRPVLRRGIADDPAVAQKRRYAIDDARRLGRRLGLILARREPISAQATAWLAEWAASAPQGPALIGFCGQALGRLWFAADPAVEAADAAEGVAAPGAGAAIQAADYAAIWRFWFGGGPPSAGDGAAVARNEALMARRGPYDTPAACVHGQWFFAHDRLAQIGERLDELGWTVAA